MSLVYAAHDGAIQLGALTILPTEDLAPGAAVQFGGFVSMHPFDIIAVVHADDVDRRLDAALTYLTVRAMDEFDAAEWRLLR